MGIKTKKIKSDFVATLIFTDRLKNQKIYINS